MEAKLQDLGNNLAGEFFFNHTMRALYATDASAYREMPLAVALPKTEADLKALVAFANRESCSLIPRTAGTSLAGQVVGSGIVVDVSKYFNKILEVNPEEQWVRVQPGVIRDDLNKHLAPYGLMFAPETSTSSRAMIGGMAGNNSCGANSIVYGSTRDHLLEVKSILSDGNSVTFGSMSALEFLTKCRSADIDSLLEAEIYGSIKTMLSASETQLEIREGFPKHTIRRRNTGYALDALLDMVPFKEEGKPFNFCELLAGSEGTLALTTELKLNLVPLPPKDKRLVCIHCESVDQALRANLVALNYQPTASELMDHYILECTKENIEQRKNRFFVKGDPQAILVVELVGENVEQVEAKAEKLIAEIKEQYLGYHFPVIKGDDVKKVWELRKAGLGLLANVPGDAKAAPVIEDTAVDVTELPDYISDFNRILKKHDLYSVHYAHAGSGEIHLRPLLDLKTKEGQKMFRTIAQEIAELVKKYNGSLSGEHGDGRLRGEFIPFMVGEKNYQLFKQLKATWDPKSIFNPGKIVDTPPMDTHLRYQSGQETKQFDTIFDFESEGGLLRLAEKCNGSGDCRKSPLTGGTMCPSYMATRNEKDTTRARANILREMLTHSDKANRFDHQEIEEVMDLCLSCKGCKSECPSNVDVAKLKAEFQHQYYQSNGVPWRTRLIANYTRGNKLNANAPWLYNFVFSNPLTGGMAKRLMGFATKRSMPKLYRTTLRKWYEKEFSNSGATTRQVYFFCDEFTNYNDTEIGIKAVELLTRLGYQVIIPDHEESGRTYLSKGLLPQAQKIASANVADLHSLISGQTPLIGLEPSAILTFRDEYIDLLHGEEKERAQKIAPHCLMIDEFIAQEIDKGHITADQFKQDKKLIKLHGHCHQKALASQTPTKKILSLPKNYQVQMIPSGCCGMAGSFGYEKEHYELSMQIGELVLFPTVRKQPDEVIIAAPGTSCRHQIKDGTGRRALHPVEVLWDALI